MVVESPIITWKMTIAVVKRGCANVEVSKNDHLTTLLDEKSHALLEHEVVVHLE